MFFFRVWTFVVSTEVILMSSEPEVGEFVSTGEDIGFWSGLGHDDVFPGMIPGLSHPRLVLRVSDSSTLVIDHQWSRVSLVIMCVSCMIIVRCHMIIVYCHNVIDCDHLLFILLFLMCFWYNLHPSFLQGLVLSYQFSIIYIHPHFKSWFFYTICNINHLLIWGYFITRVYVLQPSRSLIGCFVCI